MVKITFRTHFCVWAGEFYRQVLGGPIAIRATGFIARVLRVKEMEGRCKILTQLNPVMFEKVNIQILLKYVADCFMALDKMRLGVRWSSIHKVMIWMPEDKERYRKNGTNPDVASMEQVAKMAGEVLKCLKLTFDTPSLKKSRRMPVLDTQI